MKLVDAERGLRDLLLGKEERLIDGPDVVRQRVYRRLVRSNLSGAIRRAIPILRQLAGDGAVDALIARYLDEKPPSTRLLRQVAGDFSEWLMAQPAEALPHPSAGELAHWEALEIDVGLAPEYDGPTLSKTPVAAARVEAHPSTRLSAYQHAVQRLTTTATQFPERDGEPVILLAWRASERFLWQRLDGGVAKTLLETSSGKTLGDAFASIEAALGAGDSLDRTRVNAALVNLCRRGAIVGFIT